MRRYLARMTGLSRAQMTRLIASYADSGQVKAAAYQRRSSPPATAKAMWNGSRMWTSATEI